MTLSYLGSATLAVHMPVIPEVVQLLIGILSDLESTLSGARAALQAQISALGTLAGSLSASVVAEAQAAVDAQAQIVAGLQAQIADPSAYLSAALTAVSALSANLSLPVPEFSASLQADLSAAVAVQAALSLRAQTLASLVATAQAIVDALAQISALLLVPQYSVSLDVHTPGIYLYRWLGEVQHLGGGLTSALAGGLPGINIPSQHVSAAVLIASLGAPTASLNSVIRET